MGLQTELNNYFNIHSSNCYSNLQSNIAIPKEIFINIISHLELNKETISNLILVNKTWSRIIIRHLITTSHWGIFFRGIDLLITKLNLQKESLLKPSEKLAIKIENDIENLEKLSNINNRIEKEKHIISENLHNSSFQNIVDNQQIALMITDNLNTTLQINNYLKELKMHLSSYQEKQQKNTRLISILKIINKVSSKNPKNLMTLSTALKQLKSQTKEILIQLEIAEIKELMQYVTELEQSKNFPTHQELFKLILNSVLYEKYWLYLKNDQDSPPIFVEKLYFELLKKVVKMKDYDLILKMLVDYPLQNKDSVCRNYALEFLSYTPITQINIEKAILITQQMSRLPQLQTLNEMLKLLLNLNQLDLAIQIAQEIHSPHEKSIAFVAIASKFFHTGNVERAKAILQYVPIIEIREVTLQRFQSQENKLISRKDFKKKDTCIIS